MHLLNPRTVRFLETFHALRIRLYVRIKHFLSKVYLMENIYIEKYSP